MRKGSKIDMSLDDIIKKNSKEPIKIFGKENELNKMEQNIDLRNYLKNNVTKNDLRMTLQNRNLNRNSLNRTLSQNIKSNVKLNVNARRQSIQNVGNILNNGNNLNHFNHLNNLNVGIKPGKNKKQVKKVVQNDVSLSDAAILIHESFTGLNKLVNTILSSNENLKSIQRSKSFQNHNFKKNSFSTNHSHNLMSHLNNNENNCHVNNCHVNDFSNQCVNGNYNIQCRNSVHDHPCHMHYSQEMCHLDCQNSVNLNESLQKQNCKNFYSNLPHYTKKLNINQTFGSLKQDKGVNNLNNLNDGDINDVNMESKEIQNVKPFKNVQSSQFSKPSGYGILLEHGSNCIINIADITVNLMIE